jgi:hypothetical protein
VNIRSRKTSVTAFAIIALALLICASVNLYYIQDSAIGNILWHSDAGYVFVNTVQRGFHTSLLGHPVLAAREYFSMPAPDDDLHVFVTVITVTKAGTETQVVPITGRNPGDAPALYTPIGDQVFANCGGKLCQWDHSTFAEAAEGEQHRLVGTDDLIADRDAQLNEWSKKTFVPAPTDYSWSVDIGNQMKLSLVNRIIGKVNGAVSIEVTGAGKPPEKVWDLVSQPRMVSKTEYERTFSRH